ncbi:DsbA family protein [Limnohabitans sp. Rim11]|uniref:DsbA family protein n=1 Tax=Limnohabitans sp. Rim11 TaxID=1100719 RepID=UPI001E4F94F3|nr:DsbA family protein [Limnohabitans sp. Rim11]
MPVISQLFLSRARLLKQRVSAEKKRVAQGRPHTLHFFHQIDDPYSQLLDCVLPQLQSRFDVCIERHITSPPEDSAVPERELLNAYSQTDAQRLADHFNIDWTFKPIDAQALTAQPQASAVANALRKKWGHYLGATLYYEGEWYWGIDRLHHLEDRLNTLGLSKSTYQGPLFPTIQYQDFANAPEGTSIDFFFSLRSPYSAISVAKVFHWARQSGIEVNLRYVLPMVMRGLPVPAEKRRYISLDAAREAFVQGVPFGCVNDPLGKPTERGLALMPFAEMHNAAEAYVMSFMQGVWAEGLDAGTDKHLKIMVERAGLNWTAAKDILKSKSNDTHWRAIAEQNRQALFSMGLWGVPSFKFENTAAWGQDRFWVIEKALHDKFNSAQTASSAST